MDTDDDSTDGRGLLAGFGAWEDTDQRDVVEAIHDRGKRESYRRVEEFAQKASDDYVSS